ncbi:Uncharacterised protein [Providencia rettgeri]|uniref:Uncharacterized protein n=1 Tax=Providencia rettgeri TaxID=587 RepID=A0A9N8D3S6_PRORE|nr:Uncharacterised protein [Providencia rettgeri]CAB5719955.1 Uncharacterised protein [Providencia rettgeri]CAC9265503.1 Uncharacterised protein [Providencia rettgeri]CAC9294182.1 Uncharacterised protein [Providencia rettgeri]
MSLLPSFLTLIFYADVRSSDSSKVYCLYFHRIGRF